MCILTSNIILFVFNKYKVEQEATTLEYIGREIFWAANKEASCSFLLSEG